MIKSHSNPVTVESQIVRFEHQLAALIYEGLDTPISLSCYLLLKYKEYDQLSRKSISPSDYKDAGRFADDYQAVSTLSKSQNLATTFDKKEVAISKYLESEESCKKTNQRFISYDYEPNLLDDYHTTLISKVRSYITRVIGPMSRNVLDSIDQQMAFGPGATVGVRGIVTSGRKFDNPIIDCSTDVLGYGLHCLPPMWKDRVMGFSPVDYATVINVPKNSKTDRIIEIQPSLNIYIQKGIGSFIRSRLRRFGTDLSDQKQNQQLAQKGSADSSYATIDLSSASDSLSHKVVRVLFAGCPWFLELLEWSRVPGATLPDGTKIRLEKFSAMGNGYTFELESLIFKAIAAAISDDTSVYGDDIIVPTSKFTEVSAALNFFGFTLNEQKSYGTTAFRESCGADFFCGVPVRPFFLKKESPDGRVTPEICYTYANQILLYAHRRTGGLCRDSRFLHAWLFCYTSVGKHLRYRVTPEYSSGGYLGSFDECSPSISRAKRGWQGYIVRYYSLTYEVTRRYVKGKYISSLHSGSSFTYGEEELRGRKLRATTRSGYSLEWPDYGPWA